ncbi:uncharacterized protein LOC120664103 isoform X3 [Panicum virgatum]|uniref:uncharacterized protein LOC120664103 isoform X3 n=1 Tax=Panicum virgatum TaxID=38727 RepID=UPI0019D5E32A|nr:uncharacterized protein LOC120664103 isoform X3 [Panicum virgatum]
MERSASKNNILSLEPSTAFFPRRTNQPLPATSPQAGSTSSPAPPPAAAPSPRRRSDPPSSFLLAAAEELDESRRRRSSSAAWSSADLGGGVRALRPRPRRISSAALELQAWSLADLDGATRRVLASTPPAASLLGTCLPRIAPAAMPHVDSGPLPAVPSSHRALLRFCSPRSRGAVQSPSAPCSHRPHAAVQPPSALALPRPRAAMQPPSSCDDGQVLAAAASGYSLGPTRHAADGRATAMHLPYRQTMPSQQPQSVLISSASQDLLDLTVHHLLQQKNNQASYKVPSCSCFL